MEMLPLISVVPELNLNLDPVSGILGAGGGSLVILSMDDINKEIDRIEKSSQELVDAFDPNTIPLDSFPGREGVLKSAGKFTNIVYGFLVALLLLFAAMPLFIQWGIL